DLPHLDGHGRPPPGAIEPDSRPKSAPMVGDLAAGPWYHAARSETEGGAGEEAAAVQCRAAGRLVYRADTARSRWSAAGEALADRHSVAWRRSARVTSDGVPPGGSPRSRVCRRSERRHRASLRGGPRAPS